jgi:hypothetical protein
MRIDTAGGMEEEKRQETIHNIAEIKQWLKNHNIRRLPVVNADVLSLFFSPSSKLSKIQRYFPCSIDELITYRGKSFLFNRIFHFFCSSLENPPEVLQEVQRILDIDDDLSRIQAVHLFSQWFSSLELSSIDSLDNHQNLTSNPQVQELKTWLEKNFINLSPDSSPISVVL